jgi:hypothetical protein
MLLLANWKQPNVTTATNSPFNGRELGLEKGLHALRTREVQQPGNLIT